MFWKRTTGGAAIAGLITGFAYLYSSTILLLAFWKETLLYTAFEYQN
jgi:SSS family solute:Na+ symporter